MRPQRFALLLLFLGCATSEPAPPAVVHAPTCGDGYPLDFPCLAGGKPVVLSSEEGGLILMTARAGFVAYEETPLVLAARLEQAALSSGWTVQSRAQSEEHGTIHGRTIYHKGTRTYGASIYEQNGETLVQLHRLGSMEGN